MGRSWNLLAGKGSLALVLAACTASVSAPATPRGVASPSSPAPSQPTPKPTLLTSLDIDARMRAAWERAGVTRSPAADDATWLRRAWIDVLGTIPPEAVTDRFLADPSAEKRVRMVDELLASPLWADHWTAYWDEQWMGREVRAPDVDRGAFRAFLHSAFSRNAPWSEVVTALLTASGINSEGGPKRQSEESDGTEPLSPNVNGAVNWTLKYQTNPQDMAGMAARTLLGVGIQCAQCHDHKTEKWTQKDFQGFAAAFVRTRVVPIDSGNPMGAVKRVELRDLDRAAPRFGKMADFEPIARAKPIALDGTDLAAEGGVRAALARWVTSPENPWFARAFVNRMWAHFLGRGFVDPVDDFRPSNPVTSGDLLDAIATDFVQSGDDIKHLVRVIVGSEVYGLSARPLSDATRKADPDVKLWERFRVTPLGPEELLNALVTATKLDAIVRSTGRLDLGQVRFRVKQRYGFLFDVDEESDADDYQGTVAQALALLNGNVVATGASVLPGSALADLLALPGDRDEGRLGALYRRVLSREPTADETVLWTKFLAEAQTLPEPSTAPSGDRPKPLQEHKQQPPDPLRGLGDRAGNQRASARVKAWEDVLWALLNSSEFTLNH
jgi:hypothetical protein